MIRPNRLATILILATVTLSARAQSTAPAADTPAVSAPAALDPVARDALQMLHDRRDTLKDFQAKVIYDVVHNKTDDREGKLGTVDYLGDPTAGPTFSVRFDTDTADGVPVKKHRQEVRFDGTNVTVIDRTGKTFTRRAVVAPDAKPGDATSLNGNMPLPIGLSVDDVAQNFDVKVVSSSTPDQITLKLTPHPEAAKKFDFKKLELTIDKKVQLPIKVVRTERNGDQTTVQFSEPAINTNKSTMVDTTLPTGADWTLDLK